jgi:hypothetical protein
MRKPTPMTPFMLGVAFWLAASCGQLQAQEFTADIVKAEAGGAEPRLSGKLNVSNGKVRLETSDLRDGYFVVRGDAGAAWFLRPAAGIFMDAKQSSVLTQLFVALDPDDPCRQWQAMAKIAGAADHGGEWRCERVGDDRVDGLDTIKYQAVSPQGRRYVSWINPQLRFSVRLETEDGGVVGLVNIREAPQPESLFIVPAGYRKFDPQHLINIIKQSDVWVEPPPP